MIFYLYFCTKSIERGFQRVGSRQHCCLGLHWFRRAEGVCLAQSDLTQCLQYLPTCFLMAQWLQFHQRVNTAPLSSQAEWSLFPVHTDPPYMSERPQRVTVWIELIPLCAFVLIKISFIWTTGWNFTLIPLCLDFGGREMFEVLHLFLRKLHQKIVFNLSVPVG